MKRYKQIIGAGVVSLALALSSCGQNDTADATPSSSPSTYYVAKSGNDNNTGNSEQPFLTINHAAQVAQAGDTIIVQEGVYRERVSPARGGTSDTMRITYQAADGADVRILGSELATGWQQQEDETWLFTANQAFFGELNPFNTLSRHPIPVEQDEAGDGWGWLKYGRWTHLGDVIINGQGLTEKQTLDEVIDTDMTWYTETHGEQTSIWANFGDTDPETASVEINSRGYAFFPKKSGLNYITLKGFTIQNVASHWAPPIPYQPAAVGTNGGHHWIIEDNIIAYAKAACISLGIPTEEDYRSDITGHHIIRNNVLLRCGQAGVMGQSWAGNTQIYGNHIEDTNYREEFGGWETAAIKHHVSNALVVKDNFIRGVFTPDEEIGAAHGIWNDFRNSNWRVSNNIILGAEANAILSEANWDGPNLYENNIVDGGSIGVYSSRGDVWAHNLFINSSIRWENQDWGNRTQIGDDRWLNNIFVGEGMAKDIVSDKSVYARNVYLDGAEPHADEQNAVVRTVTDTKPKIASNHLGVTVMFNVDEVMRNAGYPVITHEDIALPFDIDAGISNDFYGNERQEKTNGAGPFARLHPGGNEFIIYQYPPLYRKALAILEGS